MRVRWGVSAATIFVALSFVTMRLVGSDWTSWTDMDSVIFEFFVPAPVVLLGLITVWPSISPNFPKDNSWAKLLVAACWATAGAIIATIGYILLRVGGGYHGMGLVWAFILSGHSFVAVPVSFLAPRFIDPTLRPNRSSSAA